MWIDTFAVKFKTLNRAEKGLRDYLYYLTNNRHQNHTKEGHRIYDFKDRLTVFRNLRRVVNENYEKMLKKGIGGRPPTKYGQSIGVFYPFRFKNEAEQKEALNKLINRFIGRINKIEGLGLSKEELSRYKRDLVFYNIHTQPKGSKTQFNIVMSEQFGNTKLDLSKKKYSLNLKLISNQIALEFGHKVEDYIKKEDKNLEVKANQNTRIYKENKLDVEMQKAKDLQVKYKEERERLKLYQEIIQEQLKEADKTLKTYLKRVEDGIEQDNLKKIETNLKKMENRLKKTGADLAPKR